MGFCGGGDTAAFVNMENIFRNDEVTKYECVWAFMVAVIFRPSLILKTYM